MPHSYLPRRFRYTTTLRDAFLRDGIASLQDLDDRGWVAGSDANAFVCNHDTERVCPFRYLSLVDDTPPRTPSLSTLIRLRTRTRWLPSSPCMCQYPHLFRICFSRPIFLSHLALILTARLLSCLAIAIFTTLTLEDQTGV